MSENEFQLTLQNQLDLESAITMINIVVHNRFLDITNIKLLMIAKSRLDQQIRNIQNRAVECDHEDVREFCSSFEI